MPLLEIKNLHASIGDKPILKGINLTECDFHLYPSNKRAEAT